MMEILEDPLKLAMLCILVVLEVPAAIFLVWAWIKAQKESGNYQG